jgi:hypothetical protein
MREKYVSAFKFFTESKNEEQLNLTYSEYESFMHIFNQTHFYMSLDIDELDNEIHENLPLEYKYRIYLF